MDLHHVCSILYDELKFNETFEYSILSVLFSLLIIQSSMKCRWNCIGNMAMASKHLRSYSYTALATNFKVFFMQKSVHMMILF